jgi:hypothetical protein
MSFEREVAAIRQSLNEAAGMLKIAKRQFLKTPPNVGIGLGAMDEAEQLMSVGEKRFENILRMYRCKSHQLSTVTTPTVTVLIHIN